MSRRHRSQGTCADLYVKEVSASGRCRPRVDLNGSPDGLEVGVFRIGTLLASNSEGVSKASVVPMVSVNERAVQRVEQQGCR